MVSRMQPIAKPLLGPRAAGAYAVLLVLISVVSACAAAFFLVVGVTRDAADVTAYLSNSERLDLTERLDLPEGATLLGSLIPVEVHVPDLPLGLRLLAQVDQALLFLCVAVGALALAQVLRTVRAGRPFAPRNPTWLAVVAITVVAGGVIPPILGDYGTTMALDHLGVLDDRFALVSSFSVAPVVLGTVILGVAEAFRRGAALADDVDGLV